MVAIILGTGFEPMETVTPCDILRRGGLDVCLASVSGDVVEGGHGICLKADCMIDEIDPKEAEMVVLPGGLGGVSSILASQKALDLVKTVYDDGKFVAAICAAPTILAKLSITDGKKATCYPGMEEQMGDALMQPTAVVRDGNIITGRTAGAAEEFGLELLAALRGQKTADAVAKAIVSRM
ncbi:MAG: DJ-1/PfpI family protein [Oscillospiraceae bacterium]|nr:DJ-1/PfpI family protein [Oscillospiraceae bacterium]